MSIVEVSAEQLAELFYHYHQALAPDFGGPATSAPKAWDELPHLEKSRVVAAARLALLEISSTAKEQQDCRRFFVKPGEAEWGC